MARGRNSVRFIVELRHTDEGVEGFVAADGPHAHTFAGWLELLEKLEPRSWEPRS
jgi:hypothetical protein